MDPRLALRSFDYGHLVAKLLDKGIIEVSSQTKETVGVFFVAKRSGELRLIFDTRRSNCWFEEPEYTALPSAESLTSVEVTPGMQANLGQGDVEVCFYQYELPEALREFFGLLPVDAHYIPPSVRQRHNLPDTGLVHTRSRVVPMGWNWAVRWVQGAHEEVFSRAGLRGHWLRDKQPAVAIDVEDCDGEGVLALYIDNFAALAHSPEAAALTATACRRR